MNNLNFDWDKANIAHVREHGVEPEEAEQVISGIAPIDLGFELRTGEKRDAQIGETDEWPSPGRHFDHVGRSSSSGDRLARKGKISSILLVPEKEWQCWKN